MTTSCDAKDLEILCGLGCHKVMELIAAYEKGESPVELQRFSVDARLLLVNELKCIMAVYKAR